MSKQDQKNNDSPQAQKDQTTSTEQKSGDKPSHGAHGGQSQSAQKAKRTHEPLAGHCFGWGCKAKATAFNFCSEHYDHFKFGLLKKTGEPAADYEKKFEHFVASQAKQRASKVA